MVPACGSAIVGRCLICASLSTVKNISVDAPPETAIDLLRDKLGLTGTKLVCESGGCGACTVLVDGVPTESCKLATEDLADRSVTTIEGITPDVGLDPVQRALIAHDAIQCGFCIPGIVVAARAYVDGWRAARGTDRPEITRRRRRPRRPPLSLRRLPGDHRRDPSRRGRRIRCRHSQAQRRRARMHLQM